MVMNQTTWIVVGIIVIRMMIEYNHKYNYKVVLGAIVDNPFRCMIFQASMKREVVIVEQLIVQIISVRLV